jgi:hypothetical protein
MLAFPLFPGASTRLATGLRSGNSTSCHVIVHHLVSSRVCSGAPAWSQNAAELELAGLPCENAVGLVEPRHWHNHAHLNSCHSSL